MTKFFKYHGAGNDFLLMDGRGDSAPDLSPRQIQLLCDRHFGIGADGLMRLTECEGADFRMEYFNSDGSGGMMCGNGGRCIVAFARDLGIIGGSCTFMAPDGMHNAAVVSDSGSEKIISLEIRDVNGCKRLDDPEGYFLNTGTRHFVTFVEDPSACDVDREGRRLRHHQAFAPEGANINFVRIESPLNIVIRTFEKGVEAETLACGTGITAASIASYLTQRQKTTDAENVHVDVKALGGRLSVDFTACGDTFTDIRLTGPAARVGTVIPDFL